MCQHLFLSVWDREVNKFDMCGLLVEKNICRMAGRSENPNLATIICLGGLYICSSEAFLNTFKNFNFLFCFISCSIFMYLGIFMHGLIHLSCTLCFYKTSQLNELLGKIGRFVVGVSSSM